MNQPLAFSTVTTADDSSNAISVLPPEQAAKLLLWYMQWSRDLAAEMHQRRLIRNEARHTVTFPSSYRPVTVPLNGDVNPMTPALSMTRASAPVPVPFP